MTPWPRDRWPTSARRHEDAPYRVSTYGRVVELLADRSWHSLAELSGTTQYPEKWLAELASSGHRLERAGDRVRLVA